MSKNARFTISFNGSPAESLLTTRETGKLSSAVYELIRVFENIYCKTIAPTVVHIDQKGGLIGPKNLGDFWVFSLIFNIILMPKWGFN